MRPSFQNEHSFQTFWAAIAIALVLAGCGGGSGGTGSSSTTTTTTTSTPPTASPITIIPPSGTPTTYYQLGQTIAFDQNWFYFAAPNTATVWSNGLAWPLVTDPTSPVTGPIIQSNVLLPGNQAQAELRFTVQNSGSYTISFYDKVIVQSGFSFPVSPTSCWDSQTANYTTSWPSAYLYGFYVDGVRQPLQPVLTTAGYKCQTSPWTRESFIVSLTGGGTLHKLSWYVQSNPAPAGATRTNGNDTVSITKVAIN